MLDADLDAQTPRRTALAMDETAGRVSLAF